MPEETPIDKTLEERIKESLAGLSSKDVYTKVIKQLDDALQKSWIGNLMKAIVSGKLEKGYVAVEPEAGKKTYREIHDLQMQLLAAFRDLTTEEKAIFKPVLANIKKSIQTLMAATPDIKAGMKGQVEAVFRRPEWREFSAGLMNFTYQMARLRDLLPELTLGKLPLLEKIPEELVNQLGLKLVEGFHPLTAAITDMQKYYAVVGAKQMKVPELLKTFPAQTKALSKIKEGIISAARTGQLSLEEFDKLYQVTRIQKALESETFELLKVVFPELGDKLKAELEKQTQETSKIARGLKIFGKPFEGFLYAASPFFFALKKMGFGQIFRLFKREPKKKTSEEKRSEALLKVIEKLGVKLPKVDLEAFAGISEKKQMEVIARFIDAIKTGEFGKAREAAEAAATKDEKTEEAKARKTAKTTKDQKRSFREMIKNMFSQTKILGKLQKGAEGLKLLTSKGFWLPVLKGAFIAALVAGGLFLLLGPGRKMFESVLKAILPNFADWLAKPLVSGIGVLLTGLGLAKIAGIGLGAGLGKVPAVSAMAGSVWGVVDAYKASAEAVAEGQGELEATATSLKAWSSRFVKTMTFGLVDITGALEWYDKKTNISGVLKWIDDYVTGPLLQLFTDIVFAPRLVLDQFKENVIAPTWRWINAKVITPIQELFENVFKAIEDSFGWITEKLSEIGKFFGIEIAPPTGTPQLDLPKGAGQLAPTGQIAPVLPTAAPSVVVQPAAAGEVSIDIESLRKELAAQSTKLDIIANAASGSQSLHAENMKMKREEKVIRGLRDIYSSSDEAVISVF